MPVIEVEDIAGRGSGISRGPCSEFAADFAVLPTIIAVSLVLLAAFAAVDLNFWNIELAVALIDAAAELFPG